MNEELVYEIVGDTLIIKSGKIIDSNFFKENKKFKKVKLNEGLVEIKDSAFYGCDIEEIEIPSTVKVIGEDAFRSNKRLRRVKLNEGLVEIEEGAFLFCNIEKIEIPSTVKIIGHFAFSVNKNLKQVKLNEGLVEIKYGAFRYCNIEEINIPSTVEYIKDYAFYNNPLKKVYLFPIINPDYDRLMKIFSNAELINKLQLNKEETNNQNKDVDNKQAKTIVSVKKISKERAKHIQLTFKNGQHVANKNTKSNNLLKPKTRVRKKS